MLTALLVFLSLNWLATKLFFSGTPLWRNGPPEKPVLCNACGSRWRTKGTLANYTPLHARAEPDDLVDHRFSRLKNVSIKNKDEKILKRKQSYYEDMGGFFPDYNNGSKKVLDEDTSNRSSSGSAISNSESCARLNIADASDFTGPSQSTVFDSTVPSKKRTCVSRPKPSSVEKLTKDLYTILHEQQFSYLSGSSEEDLLFESDKSMVSVEIGHGSVLMRNPNSVAPEEESEASSLSIDYKKLPTIEAYSCMTTLPVHSIINKGVNLPNIATEIVEKPSGSKLHKEQIKRNKDQLEKLQFLGHHNSPLCFLDLKDILSYDKFVGQLTNDEQHQLLKYLPSIDSSALTDSLKDMFSSTLFKENISAFQKLLAEGVFDNTFAGASIENCRTLKRLALCNLTKSKWVEKYNLLKDDVGCEHGSSPSNNAHDCAVATAHSVNAKISRDGQYSKISGANTMMKSPRRIMMKTGTGTKEITENDNVSFLSPRSLFASPPENSSLVLDSLQYTDESSDQELLLDIPSNNSFPQAELLIGSSGYMPQTSSDSNSVYQHLLQP